MPGKLVSSRTRSHKSRLRTAGVQSQLRSTPRERLTCAPGTAPARQRNCCQGNGKGLPGRTAGTSGNPLGSRGTIHPRTGVVSRPRSENCLRWKGNRRSSLGRSRPNTALSLARTFGGSGKDSGTRRTSCLRTESGQQGKHPRRRNTEESTTHRARLRSERECPLGTWCLASRAPG